MRREGYFCKYIDEKCVDLNRHKKENWTSMRKKIERITNENEN